MVVFGDSLAGRSLRYMQIHIIFFFKNEIYNPVIFLVVPGVSGRAMPDLALILGIPKRNVEMKRAQMRRSVKVARCVLFCSRQCSIERT